MSWSEADIALAVEGVGTFQYLIPNVYGLAGGAESDVLAITRAGRVYDFEIKVTKSDFLADLNGAVLSVKWARQQVMSAARAGRQIVGWMWDDKAPRRAVSDPEVITSPEEWADLMKIGRASCRGRV